VIVHSWINLNALWKIVVIGLLAGAGLPALFAVGLRALAPRTRKAVPGGAAQEELSGAGTVGGTGPSSGRPGLLSALMAVLCFAVVLAAMGWGIYSIVHNS